MGITDGPAALTESDFLGLSWWNWLAGPSVAMTVFIIMAIFTTSGTFMLLFLAALQNISPEVQEAAMVDGANAWQRFWRVTLPQLKPALFTVLTLGLIGCWQVFDQIYTGTKGQPAKTTLTPAYLSYDASFLDQDWGQGAAIAFILFAIIVVLTLFQRWALRDRPVSARRARQYQLPTRPATAAPATVASTRCRVLRTRLRHRPPTAVKARRRGHDRHERRPGTDGGTAGAARLGRRSRLVAARRRSGGRSRSTRCSS